MPCNVKRLILFDMKKMTLMFFEVTLISLPFDPLMCQVGKNFNWLYLLLSKTLPIH
jgi:hypothetical protein